MEIAVKFRTHDHILEQTVAGRTVQWKSELSVCVTVMHFPPFPANSRILRLLTSTKH